MGEMYPIVSSHHHDDGKPAVTSNFWSFVSDASELLYSQRGIGWKFGTGTGLHVAPDWRDTADRSTFLRQTLRALAWNYIILDCLNAALSSFANAGGRSIFGHGSNLFENFLISTLLHCMTGFFLYRGTCRSDKDKIQIPFPL